MREFGELESAIMDTLWQAERPLVVREIRESMTYNREVAYTTVMTVTNILHNKGVLRREKAGRAWRYWPYASREEHTARMMCQVLDGSGNRGVTMRRFVEHCSDEDMAHLRDVLAHTHRGVAS
ncbi:BlaI/MecI/CopY family transcriptional regulator [Lipingzhangella sp. LS1_29]|uniref:BlaI/MecI/CopY family transcriptional regulator n=1 Tax=Lipingzhangella rawalii TaxID=2055835 RepID=A0ABU2H9R9_9ACTN|nr:BlaI/MecI/CopY family transcriptional regulator [Lipingzhangella rawalii]MDS1272047.1 BlaI/MecI/CopY family transcriptional regulator [Lipingzhangella rawalii]